jgi:hypothetical protein
MTDWDDLIDKFLKSKEGVTSEGVTLRLRMIWMKMNGTFKTTDGWKSHQTFNQKTVSRYLEGCEAALDNPDIRKRALEIKEWIGEKIDPKLIKSDGNKDKSGTVILLKETATSTTILTLILILIPTPMLTLRMRERTKE